MAEKFDAITPMMRQYREVKKEHPDAVLFFRLGDFYEMFFEDAKLASGILQIVLTKRASRGASGSGTEVPMCGIPYHSASNYINRLIRSGHKVAICEQVEDPALAKGLVKREIVRLITPGTVIEDALLQAKSNNFFAGITEGKKKFGLAFADVSTGEFLVTEVPSAKGLDPVLEEITKFKPSEFIVPESFKSKHPLLIKFLGSNNALVNFMEDYRFDADISAETLKKHFKVNSLEGWNNKGPKSRSNLF